MNPILPRRRPLLLVRLLVLAFVAGAAPRGFSADRAEELIRIHTEAIGGRERIEALTSLRATGLVIAGGKKLRFSMIAQRPNRLRLETEGGGRTFVQATDGKQPPWEFDTGTWPPRYHDMAPAEAKLFQADAEFDDPLVAGPARGYTFDFAGEIDAGGKKLVRLLVTRNLTETFSILLDPDTYFIVRRVDQRANPLGGTLQIETFFDDYRPVNGVLIPHFVGTMVNGKVTQQTKIESVAPNPELAEDTFVRPQGVTVPKGR